MKIAIHAPRIDFLQTRPIPAFKDGGDRADNLRHAYPQQSGGDAREQAKAEKGRVQRAVGPQIVPPFRLGNRQSLIR
ncbi:MAG: hypothetical protein ACLQVJ_07420 [Syntrophobacteraceae bacterium]